MVEYENIERALVQELRFDDLFPYSSDDVALFLEGGRPCFTYIHIERLPSAEGWYVCDVLAAQQRSRMVWQGIKLPDPESAQAGEIRLPSYLQRVPESVRADLEGFLRAAYAQAADQLIARKTNAVEIRPPECSMPAYTREQVIPGACAYSKYIAGMKRYLFAAELSSGKAVLDVGCGFGYGSKLLASRARSCRGLDISKDALDFAMTAYFSPNLHWQQADARSLPFRQSFDLVVSLDVIQHIDPCDWEQYLSELSRVIEPGGRLVISAPNARISELRDDPPVGLYREDFYVLLGKSFGPENVRLFGQAPWDENLPLLDECEIKEFAGGIDDTFIAVCAKPESGESFRLFPAKKYKASIILPVHDQAVLTRNCLAAIAETVGEDMEFEVVLVDNASNDETKELLASLEGDVRVITNNINVGSPAARNQGAEAAAGEYLVFLESDTVPQPEWLQSLLKLADADAEVGVIGGMILSPDGVIERIGCYFGQNSIPKPACRGFPADHPTAAIPREMQAVSGVCMLVRASVFRELAGFAQSRFTNYEDADFCLRAREARWKVMYSPQARVIHYNCAGPATEQAPIELSRLGLQDFLSRWHGRVLCDESEFTDRTSAGRASKPRTVPIVWHAAVLDPSGYADEARNFIFALEGRLPLAVKAQNWSKRLASLEPGELDLLKKLLRTEVQGPAIHVWHSLPPLFQVSPEAVLNAGRTMFESDRLPESWIEPCNTMDEIWVPCEFNIETFTFSGIAREKIVKIPGTIDLSKFHPGVEPLEVNGKRGFNFLCNLDWRLRKGWDVLLSAYCAEFSPSEDVALILKAYASMDKTSEAIHSEAEEFIRSLGLDASKAPDIVFLDGLLPTAAIPSLYACADAYVQPSRGEAWGRTYMEAMAAGLPTIGTRWSGNLEFMNDENSYLIDCEVADVPEGDTSELRLYRGHKWAEPSVEHLRRLMRQVFEDRQSAGLVGERARAHLESHYSYERVAEIILQHVRERL
jgi:GT2 family glycosyltransferase/glycosyltransferase involved in cell wall biosynthesis/SAM-dependent methyltransferase